MLSGQLPLGRRRGAGIQQGVLGPRRNGLILAGMAANARSHVGEGG